MIRLLLVGGGHASLPLLTAADALVQDGIDVTLLNDSPRLYYSGMVPEYLGGVYSRDQTTIDLERLCEQAGVRFVLGRAEHLDARVQAVETTHGETHTYDIAAFDIGTVNPGQAQSVIRTRPLHRIEALEAFVGAALASEGPPQQLAVVGGGAAGVELTLNVSARVAARRPGALSIVMLEPGERLLPHFPTRMSRQAARLLSERGVDVRLRTRVDRAQDGLLHLDGGERITTDAVLWATGGIGPSIFREATLRVDERGFVRVGPTLQVHESPALFVAGDSAMIDGYEHLDRIGVHAVRQGPVLRDNVFAAIRALQDGRRPDSAAMTAFRPYPIAPLILSTGSPTGWMKLGRFSLHGGPILRLKHKVDRRWMERYVPPHTYQGHWDVRSARSA